MAACSLFSCQVCAPAARCAASCQRCVPAARCGWELSKALSSVRCSGGQPWWCVQLLFCRALMVGAPNQTTAVRHEGESSDGGVLTVQLLGVEEVHTLTKRVAVQGASDPPPRCLPAAQHTPPASSTPTPPQHPPHLLHRDNKQPIARPDPALLLRARALPPLPPAAHTTATPPPPPQSHRATAPFPQTPRQHPIIT